MSYVHTRVGVGTINEHERRMKELYDRTIVTKTAHILVTDKQHNGHKQQQI